MGMDIYMVQMGIVRGKPALNRAKVQALTSLIQPGKPSLIVLPELFSTGYLDITSLNISQQDFWNVLALDDQNFLTNLAQKTDCWIAGTTVRSGPAGKDGTGGFRNLSLLITPQGQVEAEYQKIHPFSYGGEDRIFSRGNEIVTYDIAGLEATESWVIQPTICYDLRFPELYRAGSLRGVHLILVQANWPEARQLHWETLLRARAIENQAFVVGVNCTGNQDTLRFAGGSLLVSPKGEILAQGGPEEGLIHGIAELEQCKQWRKQFPALRDRITGDFFNA
jgi:omega-amidase